MNRFMMMAAANSDLLARTTLSLQNGIDVCVLGPTGHLTNFSDQTDCFIGQAAAYDNKCRMLLKFNLTSLPAGAVIVSTKISLYLTDNVFTNARTYRVYRVKRDWVTAQATWDIYSTGNNWQTAGGFGANDCEQTEIGHRDMIVSETLNTWKDFTLTPATKAALDLGYGWMIKADTESEDLYRFRGTRFATTTLRPKLTITYH